MRGYLSRFMRRIFAPRDRQDREALERIAARVWGADGPAILLQEGGLDDLLEQIARRIPMALNDAPAAAWAIVGALRKGTPVRFRAFVDRAELGVYVEGRNVTFSHLGTHGARSLIEASEAASLAWESIIGTVVESRAVEGQETSLDPSGRLKHWARFAE